MTSVASERGCVYEMMMYSFYDICEGGWSTYDIGSEWWGNGRVPMISVVSEGRKAYDPGHIQAKKKL